MEMEFIRKVRKHFLEERKGVPDNQEGLDNLISILSQEIGKPLDLKDIVSCIYDRKTACSEYGAKERPILDIAFAMAEEHASLRRIGAIFGHDAEEMDGTLVEKTATQLFMMDNSDYVRKQGIAEPKPIDREMYRIFQAKDVGVIFGALHKIFGKEIKDTELYSKIRAADFNLGYFNAIKEDFMDIDPIDVGNKAVQFNSQIKSWAAESKIHETSLQRLVSESKAPQPQHQQTIKLSIVPVAVEILKGNNIAVLGYSETSSEGLEIQLYDTSGNLSKSKNTGLPRAFHGNFFTGYQSLCTLTTGKDGSLYAIGDGKVACYSPDLTKLKCVPLEKTLNLLRNNHITEEHIIFDLAEGDSSYYITLHQKDGTKKDILQEIRKDGQMVRHIYFETHGSSVNGASRTTPRIRAHKEMLYIPENYQIVSVEQESDWQDRKVILPRPNNEGGFVPSNHCVDGQGRLWVETILPYEAAPSVKAYELSGEKARFLTFLYPLHWEGSWPINSSMAVSDGKLALTNITHKTIDLFRI